MSFHDDDDIVICEGVLMNKDTPVANIYVDSLDRMTLDLLTSDKRLYPFDMQYISGVAGLRAFIEARITPKTRQGLYEDMKAAGIERYSIAAILIASNGRDCSDPFWIRFKDGPQTWKEVWEAIGVYNRK